MQLLCTTVIVIRSVVFGDSDVTMIYHDIMYTVSFIVIYHGHDIMVTMISYDKLVVTVVA